VRPTPAERPRIAIAHEWLVRYAGSERVVHELLTAFPDARVLTTLLEPSNVPLDLARAEPSFLQGIPGATGHHEWFVPLMPLAWRVRPTLDGIDVVVSSSHACAKAVRTAAGVPHLCYCHTPMRYAWDFAAERRRFPPLIRPIAAAGMGWFRRWDRRTASHVTQFVANSSAVAERIRRYYGRNSRVVHPPVRTDFFTPGDGEREDYFLFVGRLSGYKRADLVVEAFADQPERLLVVGEGEQRAALEKRAGANVEFLGGVDDERLRDLYRGARALVFPADEDFGITMAEAQACGTPVIGYSRGGAVDIVVDGTTGLLIERQDVDHLRRAIRSPVLAELDAVEISSRAERFSAARFREEMTEEIDRLRHG
jgi:glycosyltransferase involved in cell wall biosynthesis